MSSDRRSNATDLDVLIIGAGISGLGAAVHLQRDLPSKTFAVLEMRGAIGGTWDLFRYPGIRSDSDLFTFSYDFKPWKGDSIATADAILDYLREVVDEHGLAGKIRFHHTVTGASWDSQTARWSVEVERTDTGERSTLTANWVFSASGYYRYDQGFTPAFPGRERFESSGGTVIHPQHWPEDLDYTAKKVVVIGSGATAVTLVPAMAGTAGHVTMLQRSPTYVLPVPAKDPLATVAHKVLPEQRAHQAMRRKNIAQQRLTWWFCQRFPHAARRFIRWTNARLLPEGYAVDEHFNPRYNPWDQRLCAVPDGDLFNAIRSGQASVVTDHIETFTETGIQLKTGRHLDADIIVTATGLNLQALGGVQLIVDGRPVQLAHKVAYKGMMLSGVPNLAFAIGYTNSSWTLKVGLLAEHFTRLLEHMDLNGRDICCPEADPGMALRPLLDFDAGYVQRSIGQLPKQGPAGTPWLMSRDYYADRKLLRHGPVADPNLRFARSASRPPAELVPA